MTNHDPAAMHIYDVETGARLECLQPELCATLAIEIDQSNEIAGPAERLTSSPTGKEINPKFSPEQIARFERRLALEQAATEPLPAELQRRSGSEPGWWVIAGGAILDMLRSCAAGEDPDMVYAEAYANSTHERPSEGTV